MILETAISNICHRLDLLAGSTNDKVASNTTLKQEFVACLTGLIKAAPTNEYDHLLKSENSQLILGYLIHTLCRLATSEKSRHLRQESVELLLILFERLELVHNVRARDGQRCPLHLVSSSLPGVSSAMFKLLMEDAKLPTKLLVLAARALATIIRLSYQSDCAKHDSPILCDNPKAAEETCNNLALRLHLLINYVTLYSQQLSPELKIEILEVCEVLVKLDHALLLNKLISTIVRYIAFLSSNARDDHQEPTEINIRVGSIVDAIRKSQQDCDESILSCLFKILDELDEGALSMFSSERHAALSMLLGYIELLTPSSLTTLLEIESKRIKLFRIFYRLTEFDAQNPLLFITNRVADENALECYGTPKLFTSEKRFVHIDTNEVDLIRRCCICIGRNIEWQLGYDIFRNDLQNFKSVNALFVAHLMLVGFLERDLNKGPTTTERQISKFTSQNIELYINHIQDLYTILKRAIYFNPSAVCCANQMLKIVVSIETLVTLVELRLKFCIKQSSRIVVLKDLLCPMLSWASSEIRTISESALNGLIQLAHLYGASSIKPLIEIHTDYIVDGIRKMLDNYADNFEVADVLAVTFKLSSIETFYYFRDIYEQIIKTLGTYHTCADKCKPIALLFYRTLRILNEWKESSKVESHNQLKHGTPIKEESLVSSIAHEISLRRRICELHKRIKRQPPDEGVTDWGENDHQKAEKEVLNDLESGKFGEEVLKEAESKDLHGTNRDDELEDSKPEKGTDIVLAEKIVSNSINLLSSQDTETRILAMKTVAEGFNLLREDEDTLLPLVHQTWTPLLNRLTGDYTSKYLEVNLCAFECLLSMATNAKDFIKRRTLDTIMPRICLFLETQAKFSCGVKDYEPYCLTVAYKCQLRILTHLGALAYHIELAYSSLWRVIKSALIYLDPKQVPALRTAARNSLEYMLALDVDCVWYFAKQANQLDQLPFDLFFELSTS